MNTRTFLAGTTAFATVITLLAASASADITDRKQLVTGPLPQPGNILVYNFVATAADVPADSPLANQPDVDTTPQTADQIAEGRKLGEEIATELVKEIQAMGMPAQLATAQTKPQTNDLVIRGYLISIQEGDAAKRFTIGFGAGAAELKTVVEGFQMTAQGLRKLGSGTVDAKGGKAPGTAIGVAGLVATHNPAGLIVTSGLHVAGEASGRSGIEGRAKQTAKEIADALKQRFQEQGWIQ